MDFFNEILTKIENEQHRVYTKDVLDWVHTNYPTLEPRIGWNQPMFTHHGTFIIGFSVAKKHLAVTPEQAGITYFAKEFERAGLSYSNMIVRYPFNNPANLKLLGKMIEYNLED